MTPLNLPLLWLTIVGVLAALILLSTLGVWWIDRRDRRSMEGRSRPETLRRRV